VKLALAYYAYALENPVQCLSYLNQVRDLANVQSRLNAVESLRSNTSSIQSSSTVDNASSASFIGSFVSSETTQIVADIADGRAWSAIEVVRSVCLQGNLVSSLRCLCDILTSRQQACHSKRSSQPTRLRSCRSISVVPRHSRLSKAASHNPFPRIRCPHRVPVLDISIIRLSRDTENFGDGLSASSDAQYWPHLARAI